MKIGILTYHRVANDGSTMQTYCLQRLLTARLPGAHVEVIDYYPAALRQRNRRALFRRRPPFIDTATWRVQADRRRFMSEHSLLSSATHVTDDLGEARAFVERQRYDAIVVGSDTVWELRHNPNAAPPPPHIYFLPGVGGAKKVAFAVSADPVGATPGFPRDELGQIRAYVEAFDFLSVRDAATRRLLCEVGVDESQLHLLPDPTLLWDFSSVVQPLHGFSKPEKLAGVACASGALAAQVATQLRSLGYAVANLLGHHGPGQRIFPSRLTLEQRVSRFGLLDLMVTDRFHGSIFALVQGEAPVVFVEDPQKWPQPNSKGRDLFRRLGLEPMVWRPEERAAPPPLIPSMLSTWEDLRPHVRGCLGALRTEAERPLQHLRSVVTGSDGRIDHPSAA